MAACTFPYNPVMAGMRYQAETLTITFKKKDGLQERTYAPVPQQVAYGLFYKKTASEVLSYFANEIKGKYKVITINNTKK